MSDTLPAALVSISQYMTLDKVLQGRLGTKEYDCTTSNNAVFPHLFCH